MKYFLLFLFLILFSQTYSQDYYWVGGAGNWSDVNHWAKSSGGVVKHAVVPTINDNVVFDANSGFTPGNNTVTLNVIGTCHDMTWNNAPATPEFTGGSGNDLNIYGSQTLQNDMVHDIYQTYFKSQDLGETITTNGVVIGGRTTFDGDGEWIFMDDYITSNEYMYFEKGNLKTNGQTLEVYNFDSRGTGARTLELGSSEIYITYAWYYAGSNHTLDAGTSHILSNTSSNNNRFIGNSSHEYYHVSFTSSNGTARINDFLSYGPIKVQKLYFEGNGYIRGSNEMDTLILSPGKRYEFYQGATQTVNYLFDATNPPCSGLIELVSTSASESTIQFEPTANVIIQNALIENLKATGSVPVVTSSSFDLGGNTNFTFPPATGQTLYWVGGAGDWNDKQHWSTVNDGVYPPVGGGCVPTPLDDVVFNNNSGFTPGNNTVNLDGVGHYCHDMTWNNAPATPEFTGGSGNDLNIYGSQTLQNDMVHDIYQTYFKSQDLGETITTNGVVIGGRTTFDGDGEWIFMDDYITSNEYMYFEKGNLKTNGQTLEVYNFDSRGTGARTLELGSSEIYITYAWYYAGSNHTLDAGTSHILSNTSSNNNRFIGNSSHEYYHVSFTSSNGTARINDFLSYGPIKVQKLYFAGNGYIRGSNEMDTLILSAGKTYDFYSNSTQTINNKLYASGNPCFVLFMKSTTSGTQANINVLGGSVDFNYAVLKDINASGSYATWQEGFQSTDDGNNTNINFAGYDPSASIAGLGSDFELSCPVTSHTLTTEGFYPNPATSFLWNDGSTADSLEITQFGQYYVEVDYGEDCRVRDTVVVSALDNIPPVIVDCPSDIVVSNDAGVCGGIINWVEPTATDDCLLDSLVSNYSPGDLLPIGTTEVIYIAYDAGANTDTCRFDVVITDNEDPVFTACPSDIAQDVDAGSCDAVVTWTAPTFTDNCTGTTLTSTHNSGDTFPIGTTTVTYTATDAAGNVQTCSFDVVITDNEAPVFTACPSDIAQDVDAGSCDAVVTWTAPTFTDNCTGTTLTSTHNSGDTFPIGTTTVTYTATDAAGNIQTCSFDVVITDNEDPVFTACPSDIAQDVDAGSCDAVVTWTAPTFTDNCTGTTLTSTHNSGDTFPIGTTTVTYTATDAAGNVQTCSFDVVITDNEAPVFTACPSDIAQDVDAGSCDAVVTWT